MTASELLVFLCDDRSGETGERIAGWMDGCRRFQAFLDANRTKVRKKLRAAAATGGLEGVLLELEVARRFVEDRRCLVEYERYGQGKVRSPDLTVSFRTRTTFHVEVTHLLSPSLYDGRDWEGKLIGVVCHKLGQLVSEDINVLVISSERGLLTPEDVNTAMKRLKERVEQKEPDLLKRFGFADPSTFFKQFQWLSGILIWRGGGDGLWVNPQGRRPIPREIETILAGDTDDR